MIPILFPQGEEDFTSNGLGRLADATDCTVTEERNGAYELTMTYPITGVHFSDITHSKIIYAKPSDGKDPQPFRIYYIGKPLNGITEIRAEHISYQMTHIPVKPFTAQSVSGALAGLESNAAEECPFTFWTDKSTTAAFKVEVPSSMRSLLGGQQGSILDAYGGEWEFDGYTAKLYNERGQDKGITLRYGKNIVDIKQEENISSTYTGVMPYWKGTDSDEVGTDEILVTLPEGVLHSNNASNFPYQRTIPLDMSGDFENPPTVERLRGAANSYMVANNVGIPHVSIDVSFIALWQTEEYKNIANLERVNLCDTVTVQFEKLDISVKAKVVKTEYDVLRERYKSIKVGNSTTNLARSLIDDMANTVNGATGRLATKTFLQKSVERATKLLSGGLGGYVVINTNADGQPEEILVMDESSTDTASKVIRINKNGIGFSTTGYDGEYRTAWTIDGHFVADFIDTGNLQANLIKVGRIQDAANKNYWDMETGEFRLAAETMIGGKTIDEHMEDADWSLTQEKVFNALTNNGQTQGIYLSNGKLYINADYIKTGTISADLVKAGTLKSQNGLTKLNLDDGTFRIGYPYWLKLDQSGKLSGGKEEYDVTTGFYDDQYGYIDFSASTNVKGEGVQKGLQIQGGVLRISTYRIAVAQSTDADDAAYVGGTGRMDYIEWIRGLEDGRVQWLPKHVNFINGIMCSELSTPIDWSDYE